MKKCLYCSSRFRRTASLPSFSILFILSIVRNKGNRRRSKCASPDQLGGTIWAASGFPAPSPLKNWNGRVRPVWFNLIAILTGGTLYISRIDFLESAFFIISLKTLRAKLSAIIRRPRDVYPRPRKNLLSDVLISDAFPSTFGIHWHFLNLRYGSFQSGNPLLKPS